MKNNVTATILALSLLAIATPQRTTAQTEGPYATGSYRFIMGDEEVPKFVEFEALGDKEGRATGSMTFTDQIIFPNQDVDGTGDPGEWEDRKSVV